MGYDTCLLACKVLAEAKFLQEDVYKAIISDCRDEELILGAMADILNAGWNGIVYVIDENQTSIYIASSKAAEEKLYHVVEKDFKNGFPATVSVWEIKTGKKPQPTRTFPAA